MMPETRRNLLCYAYRRKVAKFEECLAKSDAEGGFNLNALNDVDWVAAGATVAPNFLPRPLAIHRETLYSTKETLLMMAVRGGSAEIIKILLDRGTDVLKGTVLEIAQESADRSIYKMLRVKVNVKRSWEKLRRHVAMTRPIALFWQEQTVRRKYRDPAPEAAALAADMARPLFTEGPLCARAGGCRTRTTRCASAPTSRR